MTIYQSAVTTSKKIASLDANDVYYTSQKVTNPYGEVWYRVVYDGKTGYIQALNVNPISYKSVTGTTYKTTDAYSLRHYAGTGYPRHSVIPAGTSLKPTGRIGDWYRISYAGKTGYMYKEAFAGASKQNVVTIPETTFKTRLTTSLYDSTGLSKRSLLIIPSNTILKSSAESGLYHRVTYKEKTGYILTTALIKQTNTFKKQSISGQRFITSKEMTIYQSAVTTSKKIASLDANDIYYTSQKVTNPYGEVWYRVVYDGKTGYIQALNVNPISYKSVTGTTYKTTVPSSLYHYAGTGYPRHSVIPAGTSLKPTGRIGDWYRISYAGKTGYMYIATAENIKGSRYKLSTSVDIKETPEESSRTLDTLDKENVFYTSQRVKIDSSSWYRVTKDGKTGYILFKEGTSASYLSKKVSMRTTNTTLLRSYAGSSYSIKKTIPSGVNIQVTGTINEWYRITYGGVTGYAHSSTISNTIKSQDLSPKRYILSKSVNIKEQPYSTAKTLKVLSPGNVYYTKTLFTDGYNENWHRVSIDGQLGYLPINQGSPISYKSLPSHQYITKSTTLLRSYAGISYSAIKTIPNDTVLSVSGQIGDWLRISFDGKTGYASIETLEAYTKTQTINGSRFLLNNSLAVKVSPDDTAATITALGSGNVYYTSKLVTTFTNSQWHKITVDGKTGYVKLGQATSPISYKGKDKLYVRATSPTALRSYVGDSYNILTTIPANVVLTVTGQIGNWYKVSYDGKTGYAYNGTLVTTSSKLNVYNSVSTPYSFDSFISAQMKLYPSPQTDLYKNKIMYVSAGYVRLGGRLDPVYGTLASVTATTPLNIRSGATTASHIYGQFKPNNLIKVYQNVSGFYTTYPRVYSPSSNYSTIQWLNALESDVRDIADPLKVDRNSQSFYQFLDLSKSTGASAATLDKVIGSKGIFAKCTTGSCGQAFIDAGAKYAVNEAYLISHAMLETGNGTSTLAMGVTWNGRKVYNMYGIGAYDYDAINTGAAYAYSQGWFTPESAIIGGAEFISTKYIHNAYDQNTLYKMRWSPTRPGSHQYATDMGWAVKQTYQLYNLYQQMDSYTAVFDIPVFAR
ncbi:SH3 domain-containing protein [Exiguobacterium oxidotolerans]|uniref:SH3 domain-containing protein n=1 Tax=Exiguobacterium oxidotolerans TaxID=223958 RepID=UPI003084400B